MKVYNYSIVVICLIVSTFVSCEDEHDLIRHRYRRSIASIFRRLFSRKKPTGFQGTTQAQQDYASQSSSYYPSIYNYYPYNMLYGNAYGQYPNVGNQQISGYGNYPQAASAYPAYAPNPYTSAAQSGSGSLDFHSVLDQFVKSAGLAPAGSTGDQDTSASSIQSKGDTPDGYNLQVPYMKKHISRMAQDYVKRQQLPINYPPKHPQALQYYPDKNMDQAHQMQLLEQQLAYNPHSFISQYLKNLYGSQQAELQLQQQQQQQLQLLQQQKSIQQQQSQGQQVPQSTQASHDIATSDSQDVTESHNQPTYFYKQASVSGSQTPSTSNAVQVQSSYAAH